MQEIKAAVVIGSDQAGNWVSPTGFKSLEGNDAITLEPRYRTDYTDINCLTQKIFTIYSTSPIVPPQAAPTDNLKLKIIANLRRIDATANTQNVMFVATFPVSLNTVTNLGSVQSCTGSLQLPQSASYVQNFCASPAYTGSSRFRKDKTYEELVSELEASERLSAVNEVSNTFEFEVYPNPTQSNAEISYSLSQNSFVELSVINSLGQRKFLLQEQKEAGTHTFNMNLSNHQAGIYLCELTVNGKRVVKKLIVE